MKLAEFEQSETAMRQLARESASASDLLAEVESKMWTAAGFAPGAADEVYGEPHALGWLHQYLGESDRQRSFADHTRREAKHLSATVSTQLFTPRWVADWLVRQSFEVLPDPQSVLDPACGGGQMLLAALDELLRRGVPAPEAVPRLWGIDLDPRAVAVCRTTLKIAAARAMGRRDAAVEAAVDRNVVCGDGLAEGVSPADVVVTNPPYMGARSMPPALRARLQEEFPLYHHDLYLAFVARCTALAEEACAILAQQTLWYLKRFEGARRDLLARGSLAAAAHLGHGVFEALTGEKATVMAWVWVPEQRAPTRFWDLRDCSRDRKREGLGQKPTVLRDVAEFEAIPAAPLAFWLAPRLVKSFQGPTRLGDIADVPGSQNKTGRNSEYVRRASEISAHEIRRAPGLNDGGPETARWVYYSKGGRYAPWWGNWDWVVDWSDEARGFYASNPTSNLLDERFWYREGLCYSDFGGKTFNARWMPPGCLFDMAGPAIFVENDDHDALAALLVVLNSRPARELLNALNPTLHYQVRDVRNLPIPFWGPDSIELLAPLGHRLVDAARARELDEVAEAETRAETTVAELYGFELGANGGGPPS